MPRRGGEGGGIAEHSYISWVRRGHQASSVAEDRFHKLLDAAAIGCRDPRPPGSLYVGSCTDALHWAGRNVSVVVNAADKGNYMWHDWCVRYWMNLNFRGTLDGVTWESRLSTVVWLVLTALALGEDVLVHCRQGKHRSGVLAMFLMGILSSVPALDVYDDMLDRYFQRNRKLQVRDRARISSIWDNGDFTSQVVSYRGKPWVAAILARMLYVRQRPCNIFFSGTLLQMLPGATHRQARTPDRRSRTPQHKHIPAKRMPKPRARPPPSSSPPAERSAAGLPRRLPSSVASTASGAKAAGSMASTTSSAKAAGHRCRPPSNVPWPCDVCHKMPWRCRCLRRPLPQQDDEEEDDQRPQDDDEEEDYARLEEEDYARLCKAVGVWKKIEDLHGEAMRQEARPVSPEPDKSSALWACPQCRNMNTVHNLFCQLVTCQQRRPLLQKFNKADGDWFCRECNNHNRGWRKLCNWSTCPSRDWWCRRCGNYNYSDRKFCNAYSCNEARPFGFY